jgi:hypothetical protein
VRTVQTRITATITEPVLKMYAVVREDGLIAIAPVHQRKALVSVEPVVYPRHATGPTSRLYKNVETLVIHSVATKVRDSNACAVVLLVVDALDRVNPAVASRLEA